MCINLFLLSKHLHGPLLPDRAVAIDQTDHIRRQHEEATIDPGTIALRLFPKAIDDVAIEFKRAKPAWRLNCGEGGKLAMRLVKSKQFAEVYVPHAIAVGETEALFVLDILLYPLQSAACHGLYAGINQGYVPRFCVPSMNLHLVVLDIERDVRRVQEIIGEIFLDEIALVPAANYEIIDPMRGVNLHDMPQDRHATNLDHRLGFDDCLFTKTGSQATRKYYRLHFLFVFLVRILSAANLRAKFK